MDADRHDAQRTDEVTTTGKVKTFVALAEAFVDQGLDTMFGVMGDGNMVYIVAYEHQLGQRYIGSVDERGAVSMADGYARATNTVGLVSVTHGPGLTNALSSLTEAARARTPLVLLTAETPASERLHPQQVDIPGFVRPTGAGFRSARKPELVVEEFGRAVHQASSESRPVVLDIPVDFLMMDIENVPTTYSRANPSSISPSESALDEALGILASARNPIILAGRGAVLSGAHDALVRLAEVSHAPVATTVPALSFFSGHPLNLGICGTLSHSVALDAITKADAVIAFGASLNNKTSAGGTLLKGKAVVQCDNDAERFDMFFPANVSLQGDAKTTALAMAEMLESAGVQASTNNEALAKALSDRRPEDDFKNRGATGALDSRFAAIHLNNVLPENRAMVNDGGRFLQASWRYLHPVNAEANVISNNFGCIGLGLGTAIGFSAGRPDLLTVAIIGDGGGMMGIKEFSTAVRNNLRLAVICFNDECYGSEYSKLPDFGLDAKHSYLHWPHFSDMATAMGGRGIRVDSLEQIDALGPDTWKQENLPVLIEVVADPTIDLSS